MVSSSSRCIEGMLGDRIVPLARALGLLAVSASVGDEEMGDLLGAVKQQMEVRGLGDAHMTLRGGPVRGV